MSANCGCCSDCDSGCVLQPNSPFAAVLIHATSCLAPPKGIFPPPPTSGPGVTRFSTVPQPAIGRLESSKATPIARKAISSPPWNAREDSNWVRLCKTKIELGVLLWLELASPRQALADLD